MDTRQVLLVDAFASEPLSGVPVAVLPDGEGVGSRQLRRVAGEFGTDGTVALSDGSLQCAGTDGFVAGAVAGCVGLIERGHIDAGTHTMTVAGGDDQADEDGWAAGEREVEIDSDRTVRVPLPDQPGETNPATTDEIAGALGIDVASLDDVSADLPAGLVEAHGGTLVTPVNFLEHLQRAEPVGSDLSSLLADVGATRLCAFTFDTLGVGTDLHARFFEATGRERPASGIAAGACGAHLSRNPVFDDDRESVRIECGYLQERPGTVVTTLAEQPRVGGNALTVLDGDLTLPPDDSEDEIIEL